MTATETRLDPLIYEFDTQEEAESYDRWVRAKVQRAIKNPAPPVPHDVVMAELDEIIQIAARKQAG